MIQQTMEPAASVACSGREATDTVTDLGITLTPPGRRPGLPAVAPPPEGDYATIQLRWPATAE